MFRPKRTIHILRKRVVPLQIEPPPLSQEARLAAMPPVPDVPAAKPGSNLDDLFKKVFNRRWNSWYEEMGDVESARMVYRFAAEGSKPKGVAIAQGRARALHGTGHHAGLFKFVPDLVIELGELRLQRSYAILRITIGDESLHVDVFPTEYFDKALGHPSFVLDTDYVAGHNPFVGIGYKMERIFCRPSRGTPEAFDFHDVNWTDDD